MGEEPLVAVKRPREAVECRLALFLVGVGEEMERRFEAELLAVDVELERCHRLVEQPVPGLGARHRLFMEQFLDAIFELVGLGFPQLGEPGAEAGKVLVAGKRLFQHRVVDPVELELEEDEASGKIGELLAHVAEKFRAVLVGRILRVVEIGEGADPARDVAKFLGPADRFDQLAVLGQLVELPLVGRLE